MRSLDELQAEVEEWQRQNFPEAQELELALGVCEEAGELAACVLKLHRRMRGEKYSEARLRDQIGDIIVYLMGICSLREWKLSEVIEETGEAVLKRDWTDRRA
jgi:NTP pyrophosphatase (non-canonical NTP hydrolase)